MHPIVDVAASSSFRVVSHSRSIIELENQTACAGWTGSRRLLSLFLRPDVHNPDMTSKVVLIFGMAIGLCTGSLVAAACAQESKKAESPPPLGRMVDLGGYKFHINCIGEGRPTVVLSIGGGGFSTDWALVQSKVQPSRAFAPTIEAELRGVISVQNLARWTRRHLTFIAS